MENQTQTTLNQNYEIVTVTPVICKNCSSSHIVKFGTYKGVQRYYCKECKRKFKGDDSLFHSHVKDEYISSALSMFYDGLSLNDIRNHLKQEYDYYPSSSTVYQWIEKYTPSVIKQFKDYHPNVGNTWIADETVLRIDGQNVWMYDIIDEKTRYLLATVITTNRTIGNVSLLMKEASERAGKNPKTVITDSQSAYPKGIKTASDGETEHIKSDPFAEVNDTQRIERFHSTLKERTKVMRGLKSVDTADRFVDGWLVDYNFFRPHMSLDGKTPAEVAGIEYETHSWRQACKIPVSKEDEIKSHNNPENFYAKLIPKKYRPPRIHLADTGIGGHRKNKGHTMIRTRRSIKTLLRKHRVSFVFTVSSNSRIR
jgi:putative transposase